MSDIEDTTITDEPTGVTLTLHHSPRPDPDGRRTRYIIGGLGPFGEDDVEFSTKEWIALGELIDRWREEA